MFFVGKEPDNDVKNPNAKENYKKEGFFIDKQLGFSGLLTAYFKDYNTMLKNISTKYHSQLGVEAPVLEQKGEDVSAVIEGLEVLLETMEGTERAELEEVIEGLKLLK
jgi:hypothetical protein